MKSRAPRCDIPDPELVANPIDHTVGPVQERRVWDLIACEIERLEAEADLRIIAAGRLRGLIGYDKRSRRRIRRFPPTRGRSQPEKT